jgi:multicomponent Na+:H+ antiporter subunit B
VHGHLTPGGGFQGGAIIATGVLLMFMSYRHFNASHKLLTWVESLAGLTFATLGLAGLALGQTFLQNFLPLGVPNDLVSAGIIPIIYIAVGFKVGAELTGVLDNMLKTIR